MLDSLQCRCISAVRVHIFVLGRHLSQLWRVGAREKFAVRPPALCLNLLPVNHPITIQDDGIKNLVY